MKSTCSDKCHDRIFIYYPLRKSGPIKSHHATCHKGAYPHSLKLMHFQIASKRQPLIFEDPMVEGTTKNTCGCSFYSFGPMRTCGDLALSHIVRRSDKTQNVGKRAPIKSPAQPVALPSAAHKKNMDPPSMHHKGASPHHIKVVHFENEGKCPP